MLDRRFGSRRSAGLLDDSDGVRFGWKHLGVCAGAVQTEEFHGVFDWYGSRNGRMLLI